MTSTSSARAADRPEPMITNYRITTEAEFRKAVGDPEGIAAAYFYQQLDCLVAYAHQVAVDFFRRPQLYTDLTDLSAPASAASRIATSAAEPSESGDDGGAASGSSRDRAEGAPPARMTIAPLLARLRMRYGTDERVPSQEQRDEIFLPLFGASSAGSNGAGDFARLRDELLSASAAFAERVFDTGEEMLRERVRTTHRPFKDYLIGLQGDSLAWSVDEELATVTGKLAYPILRNSGVAAVFGISTPPREQWPFTERVIRNCPW